VRIQRIMYVKMYTASRQSRWWTV